MPEATCKASIVYFLKNITSIRHQKWSLMP